MQTHEAQEAIIRELGRQRVDDLMRGWWFWAHDHQRPPKGDWWAWLILGGRGAGKTKAGSEWVNEMVAQGAARRVGLIGETMHDARAVMVEGRSGVMNPLDGESRPRFEASNRRLVWPNGAVGELFSAEDPEQLRGPELDLIWADEFAKWRRPQAALDMAQMTLRAGERPRMLITTTPRKGSALKRLIASPGTVTTRATTYRNSANLAAPFLAQMEALFGGAELGRQELMGEILEDDPRALWRRAWIDAGRVREAPALARVVVAVDPPVTSGRRSDACGIVVAGRGEDGAFYVLADRTVQGATPAGWAARVREAAAAFCAGAIVAETNQGGELITALLKEASGGSVRVKAVRASAGKIARAEPVSLLYEQGRVHHVGVLAALEDEMCVFGGDGAGGASPDRVDALVWAIAELTPPREGLARVRTL